VPCPAAPALQWDTIKSVAKSVAGLQGRKFKELLPEGAPGDGAAGSSAMGGGGHGGREAGSGFGGGGGEGGEGGGGGGLRRKPGLLAQLQALGKGRKEGAAGEAGQSEEELRVRELHYCWRHSLCYCLVGMVLAVGFAATTRQSFTASPPHLLACPACRPSTSVACCLGKLWPASA
jgi:hypothetical protein